MDSSFYNELTNWPTKYVEKIFFCITTKHAETAFHTATMGEQLSPKKFIALLSPHALPFLESLAHIAQKNTLQHFGKTIQLFAPLYLSNFCINTCSYCSFNAKNPITRKQLTLDELKKEASILSKTGLKNIILLTGDAPNKATIDYIKNATITLKPIFSSLGIEIYAETEENYKKLIDAGIDSMTLFQETYNEHTYKTFHTSGPKKNFRFRLDAQSRAAAAGIRSVTIGALLGLDYWWRDIFYVGMHAAWLQKYHPEIEVAIAIPRMRPHEGAHAQIQPVHDQDLVQAIIAIRNFLPTVGIVLSTREQADFRDNLIQLGITKISAGVSTAVGGYTKNTHPSTTQFEIADHRTVKEVVTVIKNKGYQPVFKDWFSFNQIFDQSYI